ncbi:MAG TPA: ERF family protein [Methylocella sp.]|nr:ERF family protein [Methylocella sp.]
MQRSSETIGTIAAALAKAQAQLVNPEKSLVATIRSTNEAKGSERSFRYAPLSTGLDIVRKTLSQHEIATVQTTSIDESAGILRLSTVLAHASGEWIASDWPVCPISETATPHRMGAALTYARRYALFTLVGIAGEDDLDAPDLIAPTTPTSKIDQAPGNKKGHLNGGQGQQFPIERPRKVAPTFLEPKASSTLRDQLMTELESLRSADEAAGWAHRVLGKKNTLIEADAAWIEKAFQVKLATFKPEPGQHELQHPDDAEQRPPPPRKRRRSAIDKTVLALPTPRRIRDRDHVKSIAELPCLVCGRHPADAHHLRFAQSPALGRKVSDEFTVPLCRGHHREVHHCGDEVTWWSKAGIDPTVRARALWLKTHPLPPILTETGLRGAHSSGKRNRSSVGSDENYETKPILESGGP